MGKNKKIDDDLLAIQRITPEWLRRRAEYKVYQRGLDYSNRGIVGSIDTGKGQVSTIVNSYDVKIFWDAAEKNKDAEKIGYSCSCPHAKQGNFCKHVVAAGLSIHKQYCSIIEREILEDVIGQTRLAAPIKRM